MEGGVLLSYANFLSLRSLLAAKTEKAEGFVCAHVGLCAFPEIVKEGKPGRRADNRIKNCTVEDGALTNAPWPTH